MSGIRKGLLFLLLLWMVSWAAAAYADGAAEYTVARTTFLYAEASFSSAPTPVQQGERVTELSRTEAEGATWSRVDWNGKTYYVPSNQLTPVATPVPVTPAATPEAQILVPRIEATAAPQANALQMLQTSFRMPSPISPVYHDNSARNQLYTGPGEQYYQAVSSKGTPVYESGSDWITVLGKEGNWALIEYDNATGFRRGYVEMRVIPAEVWNRLETVPAAGYTGVLNRDSYLLDDVTQRSNSCRIVALPRDSKVRLLGYDQAAQMFYVESTAAGRPARGYVPSDAIQVAP